MTELLNMFSGNAGQTPGTSGFQASGYNVDTSAFNNPEFAAQYAQLQQALAAQQGQQQAATGNQAGLIAAIQNQVAGNQPSVAQNQLSQTTAANNQAALAQAASGASVSPAEALRQATMAQASNNQNAAGQAATLRAGEQLSGENLLSNTLQGQNQLSTQAALALQGMQGQESQQQTQNQMQLQALQSQNYNAAQGLNQNTATNNANAYGNLVGGVIGGAGAALGAVGLKAGGAVRPASVHAPQLPDVHPALVAALVKHFASGGAVPRTHYDAGGGVIPMTATAPGTGPLRIGTPLQPMNLNPLGAVLGKTLKGAPSNTMPGTNITYAQGVGAGMYPAMAQGGVAPGLAARGGVTPGDGAPRADDVPALLSSGEVVENNDAVDYFDKHLGPGFLAKLNEIGKLGQALEHRHGIEVDPAELLGILARKTRGAKVA
jgi:hypothetical protein